MNYKIKSKKKKYHCVYCGIPFKNDYEIFKHFYRGCDLKKYRKWQKKHPVKERKRSFYSVPPIAH